VGKVEASNANATDNATTWWLFLLWSQSQEEWSVKSLSVGRLVSDSAISEPIPFFH